VLKPLILEDGRILRCDNPAVPTKDCLTENPMNSGKVFKLQNTCNGCGIMAVFNLDEEEKPVTGRVSPKDIEGLKGEELAVYEHFTKELRILKADEKFTLHLDNSDDYKLYIMVPLKDGCGMIGRTDKFISPATVRYNSRGAAELVEDGPYAYVKDRKLVLK